MPTTMTTLLRGWLLPLLVLSQVRGILCSEEERKGFDWPAVSRDLAVHKPIRRIPGWTPGGAAIASRAPKKGTDHPSHAIFKS